MRRVGLSFALVGFLLTIFLTGNLPAADYLLSTEVVLKKVQARLIEVWIPLPLEDESQEILSLQIEAPGSFLVTEESEYGNRFLYVSLKRGGTQISYRALIRRKEFHPQPLSFFRQNVRLLLPDRLVPLSPFKNLARELSRGKNTPSARLKSFYDFVVENMRYDKSGRGWGRGDALFACSAKRGNCTDFHSLLMALARADNIPVLFEIGLPIPSRGGKIEGYHCWLKAFVEGKTIGIDASEAAKNPSRKAYFFGHLDEKRILLTRGRDLLLAPAQHGKRLNFLYRAYAEVDLKPAPEVIATHYRVEIIDNPVRLPK